MRVAIVGTGYVGLVTGACLSDFGHRVSCIDKDETRISALNRGSVPFFEPGLNQIIEANVRQNRLTFTADLQAGLADAAVIIVAVGTPARNGDGYADLSAVYEAARTIAPHLQGYTVIVTKSTVPVGVGEEVERIIAEENPTARFSVVSNPEFLREGAAIRDFKLPDRIVIGTDDARAREVMAEMYRPLHLNSGPILYTSRRNAELIKYAANAFLATKITFINEIADLCEKIGGDVQEVARGMGLDNRIGSKFLHAGPGYGGSCFPKDTQALLKIGLDYGAPLRIVETVIAVNEARKRVMARRVVDAVGGSVRGKSVAILGLTFKPNTDDMRDSPALTIIAALQDLGASIRAFDPEGMARAREMLPDVNYFDDEYSCIDGCSAVVIVTEWEQFRGLDLERMKSLLAQPIVVDLRNIYRPDDMCNQGITYVSIGRAA
ncbi:MAG: UDPglucose 6-dehydrogenase, partial [Variibacter sp.]|nr:UDPglucose 6-dehydrogenase [Variibacter sp.]